ncbi:MAG TPA: class D sortase [Candidatus Acidoferrum sp.]|nr:class D sortase [Candidatus Acidoferrum sp.]
MNLLSQETRRISPTRTRILGGACYFFLALGLLALGYAGFVFADSHVYQALEGKKFQQAGRLSEPHILVEGDVIGEIQVPRLGLNAIVVQGDSPANLRRAVGHISKSALPGEWGNVALAGHRDTFFRPLRDIRQGDEISFQTSERRFEYLVQSIEVVAPNDTRVLEPSTGHDLTFITCFPFHFVGPAPNRFIVHAREVDGILREQVVKE